MCRAEGSVEERGLGVMMEYFIAPRAVGLPQLLLLLLKGDQNPHICNILFASRWYSRHRCYFQLVFPRSDRRTSAYRKDDQAVGLHRLLVISRYGDLPFYTREGRRTNMQDADLPGWPALTMRMPSVRFDNMRTIYFSEPHSLTFCALLASSCLFLQC